jgi:hypothetical protein
MTYDTLLDIINDGKGIMLILSAVFDKGKLELTCISTQASASMSMILWL